MGHLVVSPYLLFNLQSESSNSLPVIGRLRAVEVGDSDGDGFVVDGERPHAAVVHRRRLEVVPD